MAAHCFGDLAGMVDHPKDWARSQCSEVGIATWKGLGRNLDRAASQAEVPPWGSFALQAARGRGEAGQEVGNGVAGRWKIGRGVAGDGGIAREQG